MLIVIIRWEKNKLAKKTLDLNNKTILITGFAGFIGANLTRRLMNECKDITVVGIDNMNDYYDSGLKEYRVNELLAMQSEHQSALIPLRGTDISDKTAVHDAFRKYRPSIVVNLAAQAGVRYSITNPDAYINSNIIGFYNILEAVRHSFDNGNSGVQHLVYASSSSVYGGRTEVPFREADSVDNPVSLYAATKKSNELLAHSYSKLYNIPSTGLRFFTVYGPAGRPDMAYFSFTEKLRAGEKIKIFNYGNCQRDFTYVDDITEGIIRVMKGAPEKSTGIDGLPMPPYDIYNIGNSHPEDLMEFVNILAEELINAGVLCNDFHIEDYIEKVPMQPGDVPITYADTSRLEQDFGFKPTTSLREGLKRFAEWYKEYYIC